MTRPIFLTGFMGSGKSTVGSLLATKLSRPFIDIDQYIQMTTQCTIADLITRDGETEFRRLESKALQMACHSVSPIIATGGGIVLRKENREFMARTGISIWLDAPFDLCWQRIERDATIRPLAPDSETARVCYEHRRSLYAQASLHVPVNAEGYPEKIAAHIAWLISQIKF